MHVWRTHTVLFCRLTWLFPGLVTFACSLLLLALSVTGPVQAATSAGQEIINRATLTYIDTSSGEQVDVESNTSRIRVAELRRFSLTADQSVTASAGQVLVFSHTLTNTGNVPDGYFATAANVEADQGDLVNLQLTRDDNGNGQVDDGEALITDVIELAADESIELLLSGRMPTDIGSGDEIELLLQVSSTDSTLDTLSNRDTISTRTPANLRLGLTNSPQCSAAVPAGHAVSYELELINTTQTLPVEREVLVDGVLRSGILVEIPVPESMQLVRQESFDSSGYESRALVRHAHDNSENWMSMEAWPGATPVAGPADGAAAQPPGNAVNLLGVLLPATVFTRDELITLRYEFIIDPADDASSAAATLDASAFIDLDADDVADARSNTVCNTRLEAAPALPSSLRFVQPIASVRSAIETLDHASDEMFEDAPIYWLNNDRASVQSALAGDKPALAGGTLSDAAGNGYDTARDGVYIELATRVPDRLQLVDEGGVAHVAVELGSRLTRDTLIVLLKETRPGSEVYRSLRPVLLNTQVEGQGRWCPDVAVNADTQKFSVLDDNDTQGGNCILLSHADDTLETRYADPFGNLELSDTALVSPSSRVFDAASLAMVPGAEITVYDGNEVALAADGQTPLAFISDENGRYFLPRMNPGSRYSIDLVPPAAYRFPSQVTPDRLDAFTVSQASYGPTGFRGEGDGRFTVSVEGRAPILDIPLDPVDFASQLLMEKRVLQDTVEPGESVQYEIELTNQGIGELHDVFLIDTPPVGFRLVPASLMLNGQRLPEPRPLRLGGSGAGVPGGADSTGTRASWQVDLGTLAASDSATVTYHLQATPLALHGDGVNSALANATTTSGLPVSSNLARAAVSIVRSGVMSERAMVFGKVYVDSSCDRLHNQSEWPIGGVKLYLQDGSFVVTDEDGQFSFYGLRPGLQVIKLDTLTLPEGLSLKALDNRHAADAESRFLDLSEGDFHRADFATSCPELDADGVFDRLAQRNQDLRGSWLIEEASRFNPDGKSRIANDRQRAGADGDLSSGLLGEPRTAKTDRKTSTQRAAGNARASMNLAGTAQLEADVLPAGRPGRSTPGTDEPHTEPSKMGTPQDLVAGITEEQADAGTWLWPDTEFSTDGRFMAVVRAGADPVLYVNDVAVSNSQIGERIANRRERAELVAWYGVSLNPGLNDIQVRGRDGFGNERILASGTFKRPAAGVRMMLRTRQDTLPADGGRTMLPIDVVINDANGYPANGVYFVTLDTTDGDFLEQDLQVAEPGVQVRIEGGRGKIHIRSSELPGRMRLSARAGNMEATLNLVQVAAARPLVGTGLIELGGRWSRRGDRDDANGIDLDDGFEVQARTALFLKGRVRQDMKLTLSYDSDKQDDTELLRDINPNEHYPTLGDASVRGFEAQSRSKLYAKLERERHSVMWGDYLTDSRSESDNLARVQRTLTGFNGIYHDDRQLLQVFAARQSDVRASEEIRGNGTALLYRLDGAPLVANSEIIERIVRDRENPGLVISSERLQRQRDYTIDSVTGLLSFSDVVPSVDADLNPVFVRVSYDRNSDLDEYTLAGFRWQVELSDGLSAGFSLTDDQNPLSGYTIAGVHASAILSLHTTASVSAARMRHRDSTVSRVDDGQAQSARLEHLWGGSREHRTTMNWARASAGFTSRDAGVSAGREEWQLEHHQPLSTTLRASAKASLSASTTDATRYGSAGLRLDKTFATWSLNGGVRRVWSSDGNRTIRFNTLGLGAERRWQLPAGRTFSLGVDAERDVADARRFRYGLDSRLQLFPQVSLYARHEHEEGLSQQSLNGSATRSRQWVLGIESDVLPSTRIYSEYRMKGGYTGRSMESASGIRGRYEWRPGLFVSPAVELIDVVRGQDAEDSVAISLGISDTRGPNLRASAQAEMRESGGHRYLGFRASLAQRLNLDWTSLVREEYTRSIPVNGELSARHQFTLGLARRPKQDNRHHAVFLADWKQEYGPGAGEDKRTYLLSTHQNLQLDKGFTVSGRLGHKWQSFEFDSGDVKTQASVSDVRLSRDLDRRWEVDLRAGWLGAGRGANRYSLGAGVSWILDRNIRLGLAYNVMGFEEPDLDVEGLNQQGIQFGLQVKFDEDWFQWLSD
ncbi:MAG: DUF11 domain-containing protein [Granulosicoccus sp.]|nr:DUF11 domain-containing protein [Granulosicoccus sp.]